MNTSALPENVGFESESHSVSLPDHAVRHGAPETIVRQLLALADVRINGDRPWDITVHDERFYERALTQGALGLGESYMDGWWDSLDLAEFFSKILGASLDEKIRFNWGLLRLFIKSRILNVQRKSKAPANIRRHYDIGNDLYTRMLGPRMVYSCANWDHASTLGEAEEAKFDFIARKLRIEPGMKILDIGCGWGGLLKYLAEKHGGRVVGITLSKEQAQFARESCADRPVEMRIQDYRDLSEAFDRVVSLGMFEHVGYKNYRAYMKVVRRCLKPGGVFFLDTIGVNKSAHFTNEWTDKYIFPNSMLPSMQQIGAAIEGLFVMDDWQNWGAFYDRTLMEWFRNFHGTWSQIASSYGDRFYRMWKYYLLSSAGAFRCRMLQQWMITLSV
ncbi:MAG TPA: cyclopropane fatty acyl phospholipid synthase [Candidatus Acidoferrales bacterium]|nr:cyclopropane fatty acyl phospholipid synthase [Candidatus Acidoferrales bacterium]